MFAKPIGKTGKDWFAAVALLAILAMLLVSPVGAQEKQEYIKLTLENSSNFFALSVPRPSQIMWLPDGKSLYYFFREEGKNGLWLFDCATLDKTLVADWGEVQKRLDEMVKERPAPPMGDVDSSGRFNRANLQLSPDGKLLLGSINNDLYVYDLASGELKLLTNDPAEELFPTFSPDMSKLAFVRDRDLYVLDIAGGEIARLTDRGENTFIFNGIADWVYEEELAIRTSLWWSPCSKKIAYVQYDTSPIKTFPITDDLAFPVAGLEQQQYPKSGDPNSIVKLGVLDLEAGGTTWIDYGENSDIYIYRVGWVPGSGELWYQLLNRDQTRLELRFADPATGASRLILADEDPAWVGTRITKLTWVDEGRFIWASEKDGWQHLYLYDVDGNELGQVTKGEWEVGNIYGFDADKKYVYYSSTEVCPMERHIYRAALDGSDKRKLSEEEGTHSVDMPDFGPYYIHNYSGTAEPYMVLRDASGKELYTFQRGDSPNLKKYRISPTEYFSITAEDGAELYCSMIKPHDFDPGKKHPVLVSIYGGPESQAVTKSGRVSLSDQLLAQEGLIVFRLDNRGTAGRGRDWCRIVHRNLGYWELRDHVEGVKYLRTLPYVDGARIAIRGGSYGGYMTLIAMTKAPDYFQVGVAGAPVTHWALYDTIYTERYMDTPQDNPEGYKESSPLTFAKDMKGKLLLYHGAMDNNVHTQNSILMIDELIKADKDFELMLLPRERHGTRSPYRRQYINRLSYEFLMRHLKGDN